MGIFSFLFGCKKPQVAQSAQVESLTPVKKKRDYKSEPGRYKPKCNFVRLDNIAAAAGVGYSKALKAVKTSDIDIYWWFHKRYVSKEDAIKLHTYLWNEKA